jgi:hypothetical protein
VALLAPSLVRMTQLTSLNLAGALHQGWSSGACVAPPAVHGCFCAGRLCAGQKRRSGFGRGAPIGAAVRAGNDIRADGVASLAPILIQMPQLASLSLAGTLHALVALELWRMVASSGCARMWVHVVSSSACVNQGRAREASRGAVGLCRESHRSSWGCVAGTRSLWETRSRALL